MTWKEISDVKHDLQTIKQDLSFMVKKVEQLQFNLDCAIRKKNVKDE